MTTLTRDIDNLATLCDNLAASATRQRRRTIRTTLVAMLAIVALTTAGLAGLAYADSKKDPPVTPATAIHGLPGNNPGHGGGGTTGASPADLGGDHDGGLHNIAGVRARQGRDGGTPPGCTAHGGLGTVNKNC